MTAIDKYIALKAQIAEAQAWAALIGSPGVDGVGVLESADTQMVIRWKANPSSPDKHRSPAFMRQELENEVMQRSTNIINGAISAMNNKLAKLAKDARDEYAALMADAGVTLP